ncbi:MAG TPA: mechanosensitive ion channel domain-containing protein [Bacteroidia bacterium]|nr:mechanosensitive ion channel domain-containing protein [Bacteroidia bacterium]
MSHFFENFNLSFKNFMHYLPALIGGIICIILTFIVANLVAKLVSKYALRRTRDPLVTNFISKIVWSILLIFGIVIALGILGLGTISNKILAGAGITTFIVGFALKDIGENFLSGLILAFSRPYKVGNLIESDSVKGIVKNMTMRQTTVEAENGKIILIPNSSIIKNPLIKYSNDDNDLRQEFNISVDVKKAEEASKVIQDEVQSFPSVLKAKEKPVKVIVDSLTGEKVKLLVIFWFDSEHFKGSKSGTRTEIMFSVFRKLDEKGYAYSG